MDTSHVTDVATAGLKNWGPLAEATGPDAHLRRESWVDGDASGGIWSAQQARRTGRWDPEVIHLVAGRMTVTPDGGEPTDISAGDMAVFPKGWSGSWDIPRPCGRCTRSSEG